MSQKYGTRRDKAKQKTRRIILETAHKLFEEKVFEKATMRKLAAKASVGLGTIFQHFSYKSALLVATFEDDMRPIIENAVKSMPSKGLKKQLIHLVRHVFNFYAQRPQLSRVRIKEIFFWTCTTSTAFIKAVRRFFTSALEP